jgi:hypothetical protein
LMTQTTIIDCFYNFGFLPGSGGYSPTFRCGGSGSMPGARVWCGGQIWISARFLPVFRLPSSVTRRVMLSSHLHVHVNVKG